MRSASGALLGLVMSAGESYTPVVMQWLAGCGCTYFIRPKLAEWE